MPDTGPPHNLRFPELTDAPNVPLDIANLAADTHTGLNRITTGWEPAVVPGVHEGSDDLPAGSNLATVDIPVPEAVYSRLKLTIRGRISPATILTLQVNADATANLHRRYYVTYATNQTFTRGEGINGTEWHLGPWGNFVGCSATAELMFTDIDSLVTLKGESYRIGDSGTSNETTTFWGRTDSNRLVSSLRLSSVGAPTSTFERLRWWLEGYRDLSSPLPGPEV